MLKRVLRHYKKDFSSCVKQLLAEKMEDLRDIGLIKTFKEGKRGAYLTADEIDSMFK